MRMRSINGFGLMSPYRNSGWRAPSRLGSFVLAAVGAIAFLSTYSANATVPNTDCVGTLGKTTVIGSLTVTTRCVLLGTTVTGDVYERDRAALTARSAVIRGNVHLRGRSRLTAVSSKFFGSVWGEVLDLPGGAEVGQKAITIGSSQFYKDFSPYLGPLGFASVTNSTFWRGATVMGGWEKYPASVSVTDSKFFWYLQVASIHGNADVSYNEVRDMLVFDSNRGYMSASGNTIYGNLVCSYNIPAPQVGWNTFPTGGQGVYQCAAPPVASK